MHAFSTFLPHCVFFPSWQAYSFVTMNASLVRALNRNGWLYWRDLLCSFSPPRVSAFRMFCTFQHLGCIILAPLPLPVFVFALGLAQIWRSPAAFQLGFTSSLQMPDALLFLFFFCFVLFLEIRQIYNEAHLLSLLILYCHSAGGETAEFSLCVCFDQQAVVFLARFSVCDGMR